MKTFFFEPLSKGDSYVLTTQLASYFAGLAGVYSGELKALISEDDINGLVNYDIDYRRGSNSSDVYAARQVLALYQKRDDLSIGVDKEAVALSKFIECEHSCREANKRLYYGLIRGDENPYVGRVFHYARRKIEKILGEAPRWSSLPFAYGPGANTNCRKTTSARWKLSAKPACSANMVSSIDEILSEIPLYRDLHSEFEMTFGVCDDGSPDLNRYSIEEICRVDVTPGELMFVPKSAKTHRSIIVEPSLNSLVQKGIGTVLKKRLKRAGVDLYDQTRNRELARRASIDNSLATVDLSSASDTISRELVSQLLPLDWYILLNSSRTSCVVHKKSDTVFDLEKFSSMGNGFTFELESLIFYALTWAVCRVEEIQPFVSVYGDDIICPTSIYDRLNEVFTYCGFTVNTVKSYVDGPFRESCGADYLNGVNVRPYYQKTTWSIASLCCFHNNLVRSSWSGVFPGALSTLLENIPDQFRIYGPDGFGDGHLVSDVPSYRAHRRERGWEGFVFDTFIPLTKSVRRRCAGHSILPYYSVYIGEARHQTVNHFIVRGTRAGQKRISVYKLGGF